MNTETKHTPGPWKDEYVPTSIGGCLKIMPIKACLYADNMYEYAKNDSGWDEVKANAKLIAAAPELLEALLEVIKISDRKHDAWDKAKEAIKKATE